MFWFLLLTYIKLLNFWCCNAGNPCPNELELFPCTCSDGTSSEDVTTPFSETTPTKLKREPRDGHENRTTPQFKDETGYFSVVKCIALKSVNDLEIISTALNRKLIDKLIISNISVSSRNSLVRLPGDWLNQTRIHQLEIRNTELSGDFISYENSLKDQDESLHWLKVSDSLYGVLTYGDDGMIHTSGLNLLNRLKGIDFSSNHLTAIFASAFMYPPDNLETIILSKNSIHYIQKEAFKNIHYLKHVDLSHNVLTTVDRDYFKATAQYLQHINLSFNYLLTLPRDFFSYMPALEWFDASNNFLFSMSEKPWSVGWTQFYFMDVSGNFIECDCDLTWLPPLLSSSNSKAPTLKGQCMQTSPLDPRQTTTRDLALLNQEQITCSVS